MHFPGGRLGLSAADPPTWIGLPGFFLQIARFVYDVVRNALSRSLSPAPAKMAGLGSFLFLEDLTLLQTLSLSRTQVSGSLLFLQNLTQLQGLGLPGTQVSGSLSFLQNFTQLCVINLSDTQVSGSLFFLQNLTLLQFLRLSDTQVSGSLSFLQILTPVNGSITALPQLTNLRSFHLENSQVGVLTDQEISTFTRQHPNCQLTYDQWWNGADSG